jgi:glycosyltransferase involved in cell wall biosynthesis
MKKILIVTHFSDIGEEGRNGRFSYIAGHLSGEYDVEVVSSDFSHTLKSYRTGGSQDLPYKTTMLHEPAYQKNVSIKRILSHAKFAGNLKKYLKESPVSDLIYCAVPSLDVADAARAYAADKHIPFIIDVQDIWPEAFHMVLNIPVLSNIIFAPMYRKARRIYAAADEIIAVSQTYADIALAQNRKVSEGHSVFLGTDLARFDALAKSGAATPKPAGEFWISYIGTLGHSYNINVITDAIAALPDEIRGNVKFVVMGDGPLRAHFEKHTQDKRIRVEFTGMLNYAEMVVMLTISDVAVNPIVKGAAGSVINKVGDYAAAGLPVVNTQENPEYRNLVDKYGFGFNCSNEDVAGITNAIQKLYNDAELRKALGQNNRRLAEEKFDRAVSYTTIYDLIATLVKDS